MKRVILICGVALICLSVLTGCNAGRNKRETLKAPNKETNQGDATTQAKSSNANPVVAKKTTFEMLQGKWQSTDDQTNFLVFENNHRKEANIIDGKGDWDDDEFVISDQCLNESNKNGGFAKEKDKYLSCLQSDQCWYIISVDTTTLSLSYMGRGNTLTYNKVK